jgi:hypothetical protein
MLAYKEFGVKVSEFELWEAIVELEQSGVRTLQGLQQLLPKESVRKQLNNIHELYFKGQPVPPMEIITWGAKVSKLGNDVYREYTDWLGKEWREVTSSEADEPLWETDAREAVEQFLDELEWDAEEEVVWVPPPPELSHKGARPRPIRSFEDLHSELIQVAMNGANNSMPYEGGEPVFDVDYWGLVDEVLIDNWQEQIAEMGWQL